MTNTNKLRVAISPKKDEAAIIMKQCDAKAILNFTGWMKGPSEMEELNQALNDAIARTKKEEG